MSNPGKERRDHENYEEYWPFTLEYSNINSQKFLTALKIIKEFIDENINRLLEDGYSQPLYEELQRRVHVLNPKMDTSVRKSINQYVILGFVNTFGKSNHKVLAAYLTLVTEENRRIIF